MPVNIARIKRRARRAGGVRGEKETRSDFAHGPLLGEEAICSRSGGGVERFPTQLRFHHAYESANASLKR